MPADQGRHERLRARPLADQTARGSTSRPGPRPKPQRTRKPSSPSFSAASAAEHARAERDAPDVDRRQEPDRGDRDGFRPQGESGTR